MKQSASIEVMNNQSPFDVLAPDYDRKFTNSIIGSYMRNAVWQRMDQHFQAGSHILELNCGTGEDAVHLAQRGVYVHALDISETMVKKAREKAEAFGMGDRIEIQKIPIEALCEYLPYSESEKYDGALSNFGGLNCVANMAGVAEDLAACLRPGAIALLCVMGPLCPWEWLWFLHKKQYKTAFRRLQKNGVEWREITIRYPSITSMRRSFAHSFRFLRVSAIGAFIPPSYMECWAEKHLSFVDKLNRWERQFERVTPLPMLADHYLIELERI